MSMFQAEREGWAAPHGDFHSHTRQGGGGGHLLPGGGPLAGRGDGEPREDT